MPIARTTRARPPTPTNFCACMQKRPMKAFPTTRTHKPRRKTDGRQEQHGPSSKSRSRVARGAIVLVSLNSPREKFWGMVLELASPGVSMRGIDLNSFEDFSRQVKAGEEVTPNAVFFPMHRVERIELDARNGEIASLQRRFALKTGREYGEMLREADAEPGA